MKAIGTNTFRVLWRTAKRAAPVILFTHHQIRTPDQDAFLTLRPARRDIRRDGLLVRGRWHWRGQPYVLARQGRTIANVARLLALYNHKNRHFPRVTAAALAMAVEALRQRNPKMSLNAFMRATRVNVPRSLAP